MQLSKQSFVLTKLQSVLGSFSALFRLVLLRLAHSINLFPSRKTCQNFCLKRC